jgi:hypothetical protein
MWLRSRTNIKLVFFLYVIILVGTVCFNSKMSLYIKDLDFRIWRRKLKSVQIYAARWLPWSPYKLVSIVFLILFPNRDLW